MDIEKDPSFAWMRGSPEACGSAFYREIVSPTELTRDIGDLLKILASGTTQPVRDELENAWRFLEHVYEGVEGKDDINSYATCLVRAAEMEVWCKNLEDSVNKIEKFNTSAADFDPVAYRDAAHWIFHDLVHLHYLRREIMFFVIFLPKANQKQRQESQIPGMSVRDGIEKNKRNEQWKKWASELLEKRPDLRRNKKGIAEELRATHGIKESVSTIRRVME